MILARVRKRTPSWGLCGNKLHLGVKVTGYKEPKVTVYPLMK